MNKFIFATSNKGKFDWLQRELALAGLGHIDAVQQPLELTEIQSIDIAAISLHKARQAYAQLQCPVLVHDGGFFIDGLNGFPAAYTRDMVDTIGIETIGKIIAVLDNKNCQFRNVATLILSDTNYQQFFDSTQDVFTLTDQVWPHDHPKQWSELWRVLVPSKFGYTTPLAGLNDIEIEDYFAKRRAMDAASAIKDCVLYLQNHLRQAA